MCRRDDYPPHDDSGDHRADTVCECGHWYEEHDDGFCEGCAVGGVLDPSHPFAFDPAENTVEAITNRGGDPDMWPEWVKQAVTASNECLADEEITREGRAMAEGGLI